MLATVAAFAGNVDMTTAATAAASEVGMLIDGAAAQKLQDSFTTHKILPQCDRVIDYATAGKKDLLGLDGTDSPYAPSGAKRVPGFVQWQLDVPAGADTITASMRLAAQAGSFSGSGSLLGGGAAPKLELIVGPAGMPIQWVVKTDAGNEAASAPFSGTTGTVTATLAALQPGTYYVMIVNSGGGIIAQEITPHHQLHQRRRLRAARHGDAQGQLVERLQVRPRRRRQRTARAARVDDAGAGVQVAVQPASIAMICPVMNADSSLAR